MKKTAKVFLVLFGVVAVLGMVLVILWKPLKLDKFFYVLKSRSSVPGVSTGQKIAIPDDIMANKMGFLGGSPDDASFIIETGAAWARPHVGPFLWDDMQTQKDGTIYFDRTDADVKAYQDSEIGMLVTLWPFADWDQKERKDAEDCRVPDSDEFLPAMFGKRADHYLPFYRCNPGDWQAYTDWVEAVVERYDGDGQNDMPGLKIPIKYWEVSNEPDLSYFEFRENIPDDEMGTLTFFMEGPEEYGELLVKTSKAIKSADPTAKVLIAGAAGGSDEFLKFYSEVFDYSGAMDAFDIGNVHCISNDSYESFNVGPYLDFLKEFGLNKPVWVTEAEAIISSDPDINATQTYYSTKNALELGAERVFYTRFSFEGNFDDKAIKDEDNLNITPEIKGVKGTDTYKTIFEKLGF